MKHSIHLAAIALLTTLLVTSCDTFSAPADPDKNTEQIKDISGTWQLTTVSRNGNDITEAMDFSQFQIDLKKDGKYTIENYLPFVVRHNGTWKVDDIYYPFASISQRMEPRSRPVPISYSPLPMANVTS